jgi:hypothetical protein
VAVDRRLRNLLAGGIQIMTESEWYVLREMASYACQDRYTYRSNRRMVTSVAVNADSSCCCVAVFPAVIALFPTC